jgi:hypothetical protein
MILMGHLKLMTTIFRPQMWRASVSQFVVIRGGEVSNTNLEIEPPLFRVPGECRTDWPARLS